jgi:multicomponent Na+:H+ antiporter subunit G
MIRDAVVALMLLCGSTLMLFASIGLLRFRDVLCRSHALAKATTFGICTMIMALWLAMGDALSGFKLGLVLAFSLLTIPLASHLIALLIHRETTSEEGRQRDADDSTNHDGDLG